MIVLFVSKDSTGSQGLQCETELLKSAKPPITWKQNTLIKELQKLTTAFTIRTYNAFIYTLKQLSSLAAAEHCSSLFACLFIMDSTMCIRIKTLHPFCG